MVVRGKKLEDIKVDITLDEMMKALKNEALGREKGGRVEEFYIKDDNIVCNISKYENESGIAVISADKKVVKIFKLLLELEAEFKK